MPDKWKQTWFVWKHRGTEDTENGTSLGGSRRSTRLRFVLVWREVDDGHRPYLFDCETVNNLFAIKWLLSIPGDDQPCLTESSVYQYQICRDKSSVAPPCPCHPNLTWICRYDLLRPMLLRYEYDRHCRIGLNCLLDECLAGIPYCDVVDSGRRKVM